LKRDSRDHRSEDKEAEETCLLKTACGDPVAAPTITMAGRIAGKTPSAKALGRCEVVRKKKSEHAGGSEKATREAA